jgi:hypothetical protein
MTGLTTRQQASRSGRARRVTDPADQQRFLASLGVEVPLDVLRGLPRGAWSRFVPEDKPLQVARPMREQRP